MKPEFKNKGALAGGQRHNDHVMTPYARAKHMKNRAGGLTNMRHSRQGMLGPDVEQGRNDEQRARIQHCIEGLLICAGP